MPCDMQHPEKELWRPSAEFKNNSNLSRFIGWLQTEKGLAFSNYDQLWKWSNDEFEIFWEILLDYFQVQYDGHSAKTISQREMPGVRWFEGIRLSYSEHIFRNANKNHPAMVVANETGTLSEMSWDELESKVAALQHFLKKSGIVKGDRIVAYVSNIPEATIALLATNSLGAIWSSCSPDFGTQAVVDRFAQIKPRVLIAVTGYTYGGKFFDKKSVLEEVVKVIPSLEKVIVINPTTTPQADPFHDWNTIVDNAVTKLTFERTDFNDPLWVLYSSGTTGLPKAITHSQGGVLLEQLKYISFHQDVHGGERCFWYTTTGWMMWNHLHGCLLCGATIVLFDGSPALHSMDVLWKLAEDTDTAHFGVSAGFILGCMKGGVHPTRERKLPALRSIGSTGSTLPPEGFDWIYSEVKKDLWLTSMSGGTDICSAFVGGNPLLPVNAGEIQCRALGCSLESWDEGGHPVVATEGEMVITRPMPSMPVFFWNDPDFKRYRESYFEYYPGVWRHGDWIEVTSRNGIIIYGRSDATLNRGGVRIGTSEIYRTLDTVEEVKDSIILCIEKTGGEFYMPLFVVMQEGQSLTDAIRKKINQLLRTHYSPRHVPDEIIEAPDVPYTLSGKKTEAPIKKILMGKDPANVVNFGTLRNPGSIHFFAEFAKAKLSS